jgi:hypothetical protein
MANAMAATMLLDQGVHEKAAVDGQAVNILLEVVALSCEQEHL